MTLNVAVQMDHISKISVAGDSTLALMLEAERRGHTLHHYTPDRLVMREGRVEARVEPVKVRDLWNHQDLAPVSGAFAPEINSHGAGLYLLRPQD